MNRRVIMERSLGGPIAPGRSSGVQNSMSQTHNSPTRPTGRTLLVCSATSRTEVRDALASLGYGCAEADHPYAAMVELCKRPLVYHAMVLSLSSLYREELTIIAAVKRRFPQVELWLAHTDGRQAALAEAMRLGADGLLDAEGLHRLASSAPIGEMAIDAIASVAEAEGISDADSDGPEPDEPILSQDELRALLQEQPGQPSEGPG
jgi:hypothetical protein